MADEKKGQINGEELLLSCVRQLNSTDDFDTVMNHVLSSILAYYNGSRAYVFEFDWNSNTVTNTHEVCADGVSPEIANLCNIPAATVDPWLHAFEHDENIFIIKNVKDLSLDPLRKEEYEILNSQHIRALIAVPIRFENELHGFLGVDDPDWHTDDPSFLVNLTFFICNEMNKRKLSEELKKLSFSDYLTQFNNRNAYNVYLRSVADTLQHQIGIVFADLNDLKYMNDTYGHEYGDKLLRYMATVLRRHFPLKSIYRISGDEFVIICTGWSKLEFQNLVSRLQSDLIYQSDQLASLGHIWTDMTGNIPELVYQAEQMMYKNKHNYHKNIAKTAQNSSNLLSVLLKNMKLDEFTFYLQPQFRLLDHELVGVEALARQITPEGELLYPYDFIPLFEKEGLISALDFYLLDKICMQIVDWRRQGYHIVPIAVNFSSASLLETDFTAHFCKLCEQHLINPSQFVIEISRARTSLDRDLLKRIIQELQDSDISVRIKNLTIENDFPAMLTLDGVSSFKLDLSLVREMSEHYRTQLLVQTLIQLCHRMGQECFATGIETQKQESLLLSMDCDCGQGFLMKQPLSISEFEKLFLADLRIAPLQPAFSSMENKIPLDTNALDSSVFELLCQTSDKMYIYISNLTTDFSRWSPAAVQYFGLPGEYMSDTAAIWSTYIYPDDVSIFANDMKRIIDGKSNRHSCEYRARNKQGEYVWVRCSGAVLRSADGSPNLFAGTMINLGSQSKFDPLTGLYSIYEYQMQLGAMLENGASGVMLLFGFDHFKRFNDTQGYQAGDKILHQLGIQLQQISHHTFYRMDGDKISCIIENGSRLEASLVFDQIIYFVRNIPFLQENDIYLTLSCGAVFFPEHGTSIGELRACAEYALEQAKKDRRGSLAFYSSDLHQKSIFSFHLLEVLHHSVQRNFEGFSLYYQPLINAATGIIWGAEALLRFSSSSLPPVYPDEFIPALEESGLITEVGSWVMKTAFRQTALWRQKYPHFHLTFNVSYIQMQKTDFCNSVMRELKYSSLPSEAIIIELTESCKITEPEKLKEDFTFFAKNGIQVALDDFGTGYASIGLLRELTPQWVKIDHTFVASIKESHMDRAILEYILDLCRHAKIHICIEGVENNDILNIIRSYHPDLLQGYYYARPLPPDEFEQHFLGFTIPQ